MNIILIGFMGSGKSVVGQKLAGDLGFSYLDTDLLIEKTQKMSINSIFSEKGESYFRDLETEVVATLENYDNFVIATGGGMILRPENVTMLKQLGPLFLLWAEPEVVLERVKKETQRPLLKVADPLLEINRILNMRKHIYQQAADYTIDTSKLNVLQVVQEIRNKLKEAK